MKQTFASRTFSSRTFSSGSWGGGGVLAAPPAAVHYRCLMTVQTLIEALALANSPTVVVKKMAIDRNLGKPGGTPLPAIICSPFRETMDHEAGVNAQDDVVYPVQVTIVDRDNQEPTLAANLAQYLLWRQQIARAFRQQALAGVPEIINAWVEPGAQLLPEAWAQNLYASVLILNFVSREARGVS